MKFYLVCEPGFAYILFLILAVTSATLALLNPWYALCLLFHFEYFFKDYSFRYKVTEHDLPSALITEHRYNFFEVQTDFYLKTEYVRIAEVCSSLSDFPLTSVSRFVSPTKAVKA